jgi:pimeloyl-ACP methyl ester carboxylesterase
MPFVENEGIKIYYDTRGDGEPLVLLHGFTSNRQQWDFSGYSEQLQTAYRVISIDLRGHGQSGKPHTSDAYGLGNRLSDINAVLDALAIPCAHFLGYSMGGWLAFGMAAHYPARVSSLIIGGAHPYEESLAPFRRNGKAEPEGFIAALGEFIGEEVSKAAKPFILNNDLVALCASATDRESQISLLKQSEIPMMLFVGEQDQRYALVLRAADELQVGAPLVIPRAGHTTALFSVSNVLPQVNAFLFKHSSNARIETTRE